MSYVLLIYPRADPLLGWLRRKYDPTADVVEPHIAVVYPVPESVGRDRLIAHVATVTGACAPFDIRLGGFHKSPDQWLFLTLAQGRESVGRLHRLLYTGLLAEFRETEREFVPHLGLGLFLKKGSIYDWKHPREEEFDAQTYEAALQEAQPLLAGPSERIDTLHLAAVPDEVLEWSSGERSAVPKGLRIADIHAFRIGA